MQALFSIDEAALEGLRIFCMAMAAGLAIMAVIVIGCFVVTLFDHGPRPLAAAIDKRTRKCSCLFTLCAALAAFSLSGRADTSTTRSKPANALYMIGEALPAAEDPSANRRATEWGELISVDTGDGLALLFFRAPRTYQISRKTNALFPLI